MHLQPQAAQGVVHQEADNPVRGEELRGRRNVLLANFLFLTVKSFKNLRFVFFNGVLIHPPDGLLGLPGRPQCRRIEQGEHFPQRAWAGHQPRGQAVGVEEHLEVLGYPGTLVKEKTAVGVVHPALKVQGVSFILLCEKVLKPRGLGAPAQGLRQQATDLHHLEGHQAVKPGESCFFDQRLNGLA